MKMVMKATERTLIICCISGGGSALLCLPRPPITIDDLARTSSILLESGMDITKINVIRKRLELIKGGRLAAAAFPATLVTLVLSDVIGDRLDLIASGPTVLDDGSTWEDAALLLHSYGLMSKSSENSRSNDSSKEVGCEDRGAKSKKCFLPRSVIDVINRGLFGELDDSPRGSHPIFSTKRRVSGRKPSTAKLCEVFLVGSTRLAVLAAAREAERFGYNAVVLGTRIQGEASDVAGIFAALAEQLLSQSDGLHSVAQLPAALLAGGETTVTILDGEENGTGGRNQEVGLSAALHLKSMSLRDVVIASVGTDGTDGPTDAAGAIVDGTTIDRVENANDTTVTGEAALKRHDAYTFLQSEKFMQSTNYVPSLVRTGPTGTNVADVAVILVR